ncbi:MAG: DUF1638 domain-containing protein [Bryobacteraceae bacterium]|nr:DUF1638 domain-containing protein [Bryobacteraceae bacterium]
MRLKLIACEILYRELCASLARSPHQIDVEFLPKGLHDIGGAGMRDRLQAVVDRVDESLYSAVLLGYALCGMGLAGLTARGIPLVLPRGHDCITLFLGSRERYMEYFTGNPGVYFKTTGWIERGKDLDQLGPDSFYRKTGLGLTYEEMVEKYGEENAQYLWDQIGGYTRNYGKLTFIEMGVEPDDRFERHTEREAVERGMGYQKITGDMRLIHRLVNGEWNDEFLVVPPGCRVAASHDDGVIRSEKSS